MTILHQEAHRPADKKQPLRYSRHYYDLALMVKSDVKKAALIDIKQLQDVVAFNMRFYPSGWSKYETAKPGSLKLIPSDHVLSTVRSDYVDMRNMIFGEYPPFDEIISVLQELQDEINE